MHTAEPRRWHALRRGFAGRRRLVGAARLTTALWPVLARRYARGLRATSSTRRAACARAGAASEAARGRSRCAAGLVERGQVLNGRHRAAHAHRGAGATSALIAAIEALQRSDRDDAPNSGAQRVVCTERRGEPGAQGRVLLERIVVSLTTNSQVVACLAGLSYVPFSTVGIQELLLGSSWVQYGVEKRVLRTAVFL